MVCSQCCDRTPLRRMGYVDPVLVCKNCVSVCKMEEEFLHNQLKLLVHGAHFHLSDSPDASNVYCLKLSSDHGQIVMGEEHDPINMRHILEVKTHSGDPSPLPDREGDVQRKKRSVSNPKVVNLELILKGVGGGQETKLTVIPSSSHSRKTSVEWLKALKKALILLHNSK